MVTTIWRVLIFGLILTPRLSAQEPPVVFDGDNNDRALGAQSKDEATSPDGKACTALAAEEKLPWLVNSAEFVQPPFTAVVTVGPRDSWKR